MSVVRHSLDLDWPGIEAKPEVDLLVKRCGRQVKTYFNIRHLPEYFNTGQVMTARLEPSSPVVGFALVRPSTRHLTLAVYEIGVDPDHRRKGIAREMLTHLRDEYPVRSIKLVVNANNPEAQGLYASMGFKLVRKDTTKAGNEIHRLELPSLMDLAIKNETGEHNG
jgi:ribosomal protein S18 acetylase RimI-like enzyme